MAPVLFHFSVTSCAILPFGEKNVQHLPSTLRSKSSFLHLFYQAPGNADLLTLYLVISPMPIRQSSWPHSGCRHCFLLPHHYFVLFFCTLTKTAPFIAQATLHYSDAHPIINSPRSPLWPFDVALCFPFLWFYGALHLHYHHFSSLVLLFNYLSFLLY